MPPQSDKVARHPRPHSADRALPPRRQQGVGILQNAKRSPKIIRCCCCSQTRLPETASRRPSAAAAPTAGCFYFVKWETATCLPNCPRLSNTTAAATEICQNRHQPKRTAIAAAEMDNIGCCCRNHFCHHCVNPRHPSITGSFNVVVYNDSI